MTGNLWRELYVNENNYLHGEGGSSLDQYRLQTKYPALQSVSYLSKFEILILADFIMALEQDDPQDRFRDLEFLAEYAEPFAASEETIRKVLLHFIGRNWLCYEPNPHGPGLRYRANQAQLIKEGLYTYDRWRNLFRLGLYQCICKN